MEDVDEICRYLKPFLGEKADRIWQAYQVADFEGRKQIERYLRILSLQYLQATPDQPPAMFLPPPAEVLAGDYPVGHVILQEKTFGTFAIREDEWLQHVAILWTCPEKVDTGGNMIR